MYEYELESNAFREWPLLTSVIIGKSVVNINNGAFASCKKLEYVQFPEKLMRGIGEIAFYECISLVNITIRFHFYYELNYAFAYCNNLETIFIGENVNYIGSCAFINYISLKCIHFNGEISPENKMIYLLK